VVGAANNQLSAPESADLLAERGIVYAPDYVVNAGGIISVAEELAARRRTFGGELRRPASLEQVAARVARIEVTTIEILDRAKADGITTAAAADAIAETRLARARAGSPTGSAAV
jgi:glutamate dehydrogenase/leucine dehydrogenase